MAAHVHYVFYSGFWLPAGWRGAG